MEDHSAVLYVYLLGRFTLEREGPDGKRSVIEGFETVFRRGQSAILFKLLLTHPERRVKRDLLVRAIWPGQLATAIRKSLDVTKSVLGRTLEELCGHPLLPRVSGDPPIYATASQSLLWTDLDACEEAIRQALVTKDPAPSLAHWERAYSFLQRGELLADDTAAYWYLSPLVQDRRTRLSKQRTQCVSRIADLSLECGDIRRALEVLTQECEADPAHEDLACHLMNVLARLGRYTEALTRYTQLEAVLLEQGAVPREETRHLSFWLRAKGPTKRFSGWSSEVIGMSVSVRPSSQENRTDEVGAQTVSITPVQHPHPPSLSGHEHELTTLSQWITGGSKQMDVLPTDLHLYEKKLRLALHIHRTSNAQGLIQDVDNDIYELESLEEQFGDDAIAPVRIVLIGNGLLATKIVKDQKQYALAYAYANNTVRVAKGLGSETLLATTRYNRGCAKLEWGLFGVMKCGRFQPDRRKIQDAIKDFQEILVLSSRQPDTIHPQLRGWTQLQINRAALNGFKQTLTDYEREKLLELTNQAAATIGCDPIDDHYNCMMVTGTLSGLHLGGYHLVKAGNLNAAGSASKAMIELHQLKSLTERTYNRDETRNQAWIDIAMAETLLVLEDYSEATIKVKGALIACHHINSIQNVAMITDIYSRIVESPYGISTDVKELGDMLTEWYGDVNEKKPG